MKLYVWKNRRNGKYIRGTDRRRFPSRQRLTDDINEALTIRVYDEWDKTRNTLDGEEKRRSINPGSYKAVQVSIKEV